MVNDLEQNLSSSHIKDRGVFSKATSLFCLVP